MTVPFMNEPKMQDDHMNHFDELLKVITFESDR